MVYNFASAFNCRSVSHAPDSSMLVILVGWGRLFLVHSEFNWYVFRSGISDVLLPPKRSHVSLYVVSVESMDST